MRAGLALVCAVWLCACSAQQTGDVVTADGYGPVRIGMTLAEAEAAVGHPLALDDVLAEHCESFGITVQPNGAGGAFEQGYPVFEAEDGRVTRVSFYGAPTARTPEGVGVGSTNTEVRAAYPNAVEAPAYYVDPPAHDLIVWLQPQTRGYRFEVGKDGVVHSFHAGGPSILLVEGCV